MRLITRSDFDGLACAVLLEEVGLVDDYLFVHPKDVQDGLVEVDANDILANVPFVPGCGLWFDHHASEAERLQLTPGVDYQGASGLAPSCARIIYDYYGGEEKFAKFDRTGLMSAVDKADSAAFTRGEILDPHGWVLLAFIMDARTGLGRYRDYRISNLALMRDMIGYCRHMQVEEILDVQDVKERVDRYFHQEAAYREMLLSCSRSEKNVIIIDLRDVGEILSGNRFIEYALFPEQNVSLRVLWGRERKNVVFTVGHSILNRTCAVNVGSLMLGYGGGGHVRVGTCQVPVDRADRVLAEILEALQSSC